jgi:hypothetical protein
MHHARGVLVMLREDLSPLNPSPRSIVGYSTAYLIEYSSSKSAVYMFQFEIADSV